MRVLGLVGLALLLGVFAKGSWNALRRDGGGRVTLVMATIVASQLTLIGMGLRVVPAYVVAMIVVPAAFAYAWRSIDELMASPAGVRLRLRFGSEATQATAVHEIINDPSRSVDDATAAAAVRAFVRFTPDLSGELAARLAGAGAGVARHARTLLGADDARTRAQAVLLVGHARAAADLPRVAPLLADRDPLVRVAAALALGRLRDPAAIPLLRPLLDEPALELRIAALRSLGELGDVALLDWPPVDPYRQSVPSSPLALLAAAAEAELRRQAAVTIATLGDRRGRDVLLAALGDRDTGVRHAAAHALDRSDWWPQDAAQLTQLGELLGHFRAAPAGDAAAEQIRARLAQPPAAQSLEWLLAAAGHLLGPDMLARLAAQPDVPRQMDKDDMSTGGADPLVDLSTVRGLAAAELRRRQPAM